LITSPNYSQISRLYRPLDTATPFSDDEDEPGTQLLPTHKNSTSQGHKHGQKSLQLADPWDEREELFGIGNDSDQEEEEELFHTQSLQTSEGRQAPEIAVTNV
jgi:hypothetical protein